MKDDQWRYLVILDACRYDYFKKIFKKYLKKGKLKKVYSPASTTAEWIKKVFQKKYSDVVYVSANPHINSKNISKINNFSVNNKFFKIIDAWLDGWDKSKLTVPPEAVNKIVLKNIPKYPDKRFIIHYMQPHAPYLNLEKIRGGAIEADRENRELGKKINFYSPYLKKFLSKTYNILDNLVKKRKITWKILELLKIPSIDPIQATLQQVGQGGLLQAYNYNLERVLKNVKNLTDNPLIKGKMIITADHGELLGENWDYSHRKNYRHNKLIEVPHLEIK